MLESSLAFFEFQISCTLKCCSCSELASTIVDCDGPAVLLGALSLLASVLNWCQTVVCCSNMNMTSFLDHLLFFWDVWAHKTLFKHTASRMDAKMRNNIHSDPHLLYCGA